MQILENQFIEVVEIIKKELICIENTHIPYLYISIRI
jgi:hypothetical protein